MLIWYRLTAWLRGRGKLREVYRVHGVPMSKRAYMALRHGVGVAENE